MKKVFFLTSLVVLLAACSKDESISSINDQDNATVTSKAGNRDAPAQNIVRILTSGFSPDSLMVNVNSAVAWLNEDSDTHSVTSDKFDSGDIAPGGTFTVAFDNTGTYHYYCKYHSEKAVIVVAGIR